jgi:4-alpha-glucanotransferase
MTPPASLQRPLSVRGAGILLHPTSLPGAYGIGDLGPAAHNWVDALAEAGQSWWQILPLGPTGYGDSPYQCFSAFAGNPNLLSPETVVEDGALLRKDLRALKLPKGPIDYPRVAVNKRSLVERAWEAFRSGRAAALRDDWDRFRAGQTLWLDDYALFMALKQSLGGGSWITWPDRYRLREPAALTEAARHLAAIADVYRFEQFLFFRQWDRLKAHAHDRGIGVIGDMPIFLAEDSADVWANPSLFLLDEDRRPRSVAGVPPDYFSKTGQLWGNPLYNWLEHERTSFQWWKARMRSALRLVDLIRLDHFRGFEAYWEVPAGSPTAETGRWVKGPGRAFLLALRDDLGGLPLIAEDLGVITPEVDALRTEFGLPGMRILQFAFGGAVETRFLPHNFINPTVVYTGTHDNDTTRGWFAHLSDAERQFTCRYLDDDGSHIAWKMIRSAWASVAMLAIAPAQDLLDLASEARMNTPAVASGNWRWRLPGASLGKKRIERLGDMTALYQRSGKAGERGVLTP